MRRIRKGDEVIVVTGKDRGRRGSLLRVYDDGRAIVEGVNVVRKHQRANPNAGVAGGIIEKEAPIDVSNVMIFNPATGKADRIGYRQLADGRKVRYFKSNGEVLDT
jgi:large subunit ribosomal protein L24